MVMFVDEMRERVYSRAMEFRAVDPTTNITPETAETILRYAFVDVLFDVLIETSGDEPVERVRELERARVGWAENIVDHERKWRGMDWFSFILVELELQRQATIKADGFEPDPRWFVKMLDSS
jgi:hypothetical protein